MEGSSTVLFGKTNARGDERVFGIRADDRRRHMYVIGKTGVGKSSLLETLAIQDIRAGRGVCFVDPHGDTAERLLRSVPAGRVKDVVYFNPADLGFPLGFNVLENKDPDLRSSIASGVVGVFRKLWADSWGPRLENVLRHAVLSLLPYRGATLLSVLRLLMDEKYRSRIIEGEKDPIVRLFWEKQFSGYSDKFRVEVIEPVQNKISHFSTNPLIRNIIGQAKSTFDVRELMDQGRILIVNLAKGRVGEDSAGLLGALLITKIQLSAMSRADVPEEARRDFYLYVDEFQNFATESFAGILSEARKYRLNLILAHQYIEQLEEKVQAAVFGNVGTLIMFRVGSRDVEILEKEVKPALTGYDLLHLPKYQIYVRLMVDGVATEPFSAATLAPTDDLEEEGRAAEIVSRSRERHGRPREWVEAKILKWAGVGGLRERAGRVGELKSGKNKRKRRARGRRFNAHCSSCGAPTRVNFRPDGVRPVFCEKCFREYQRGRDGVGLRQ